MKKKIAPAAVHSLKEALTSVYWYKPDLRGFLNQCLADPTILSHLDWSDFKRNIVGTLVDHLVDNQEEHQLDIIRLMSAVCEIRDFSHLRRLEDGETKSTHAKEAVDALRTHLTGHISIEEEARRAEERRQHAHARIMQVNEVKKRLEEIKTEFVKLIIDTDPQQRGYKLEKVIREIFELFDLDPTAAFRIDGEQIDGAFSFEGTDYLLEAKWQKKPVAAKELDGLAGKLSRKLDNTLGLFLSINGYSEEGVDRFSSGRRMVILMDGRDLMAVLEGRIDLIQLLLRKRRHAAETGVIYLQIHEILR